MMVKPPTRCKLQTRGVRSRSEKERERETQCCVEKGTPTPPYIGQGGALTLPFPHVGLNPQGGGSGAARRGDEPLPWREAQGGRLPLPLMGLLRTKYLFTFLINY